MLGLKLIHISKNQNDDNQNDNNIDSLPELSVCRWIILQYCTEHDSMAIVHSAQFQNDLSANLDVLDRRGFARFQFKTVFGWFTQPFIQAQIKENIKAPRH